MFTATKLLGVCLAALGISATSKAIEPPPQPVEVASNTILENLQEEVRSLKEQVANLHDEKAELQGKVRDNINTIAALNSKLTRPAISFIPAYEPPAKKATKAAAVCSNGSCGPRAGAVKSVARVVRWQPFRGRRGRR